WACYRKLYKLQFGGSDYVTVAEWSSQEETALLMIQQLTGPSARNQTMFVQSIDHRRFLRPREVISSSTAYHVAFEFMPLSLAEMAGNHLINELRLASIMGQVS
ncbi:hypothetical protein B0H63DRAFT_364546, partial [Podospora didyma]